MGRNLFREHPVEADQDTPDSGTAATIAESVAEASPGRTLFSLTSFFREVGVKLKLNLL